MKNIFLLLLLSPLFSFAQQKVLMVEGTSPGLFLMHTAGPKENYYSIGRIYNISPRVMAPFNNLVLETPLSIGQVLKIPLTEQNLSQDGHIEADEVLVPLYYKVKNKETLTQISNTHHKISVATLKKWNSLQSDAVANGSNVIIGYLKVKKDLSALASRAVRVDQIEKMETEPEKSVWEQPMVKQEPAKAKQETIRQEVKQTEPIKQPEIKENPTVINTKNTERTFNGGTFKSLFQSTKKDQSGIAGVFKSTSGWEDGKYYCLHNTAAAGTIIKITNSANNKSIYAKVLDVIPDLRQNEGMVIRISNAAADELGVTANTFDCQLNY